MAKKKTVSPIVSEAEIRPQPIVETIETNYMPYAMSVIISRALPEIDGFKPAHRKLLYTMYEMGLLNKPRTKSANVVGQTMHLNPHGDAAIYETLVRLTRGHGALLHPFIDSKGSFGKQYSRDMAYAASRYTEVRLDPFCLELFDGIEKNSVDFIPNYDNTTIEPVLLPTTFPNILVSPNLGIAVGMACSICSFNLGEICDGTIALLKNPDCSIDRLLDLIQAPDFAGGGRLVYDRDKMRELYETGVGPIRLRAKYVFDEKENCIDILEIPYSTSIEAIIKKITDLIKEGKLREITDVRDAIDLNGFRLTIDLRRGTNPDRLMEKLFLLTPLEDSFDCNFNVLLEGRPATLGVREILLAWIDFRIACIRREMTFDLEKKQDKLHLLMGLGSILLDLDRAIRIIRNTEDEKQVIPNLMEAFSLSEKQAEYIAEIKLRHLNREYIRNRIEEIASLEKEIADLSETIRDEIKIKGRISEQLRQIKKKYGLSRKTEILSEDSISAPDPTLLIDDYPVRLLLTKHGFFKKLALTGNRGEEQKYKEGDGELQTAEANNTDSLLVFTNKLKMYAAKISDFDLLRPSVIGELLRTTLKMDKGERPTALCPVNKETGSVVLAFSDGTVLRCPSEDFPTDQRRIKLFAMQAGLATPMAALPEKAGSTGEIWFRTEDDRLLCINTRLIERTPLITAIPVQAVILKKGVKLKSVTLACPTEFAPGDKFKKIRIPALPVSDSAN
ncbi:MAG: topoisomerase IV [Clostridia bacterium]|nr:topoisomerase IV [Clostridia bacterium]MBR5043820.1 topoisomerase IV [Clostridia bacterium]